MTFRATRGAALAAFTLAASLFGQPGKEDLRYTINWPSGLSLGEGSMKADRHGNGWSYVLRLDASLPGVPIEDEYRSSSTSEFCSQSFEKRSKHGSRNAAEKLTFEEGTLRRETMEGGGKTEVKTGPCARDALAFLYFLRSELAKGRIPPAQTVYFGAAYEVRLQYGGRQRIAVNEKPVEAELFKATVKGPASTNSFELFFAKDAARTPLLVRAPFSMGTFRMELDGELPLE
ncbi:MAG: DUF3108 domain-containing protein [Bryobacteraceae bacterium]